MNLIEITDEPSEFDLHEFDGGSHGNPPSRFLRVSVPLWLIPRQSPAKRTSLFWNASGMVRMPRSGYHVRNHPRRHDARQLLLEPLEGIGHVVVIDAQQV